MKKVRQDEVEGTSPEGTKGVVFRKLIAEDLGEKKLVDVLEACAVWDPAKQTVVIAEGLLMYLPPEAVTELFRQCDAGTGPGSRIAFSYVPTGDDGRPDAGRCTGFMLWALKKSGEPWLWSIRPEELEAFLEGVGWRSNPAASTERHGVEMFAVAVAS